VSDLRSALVVAVPEAGPVIEKWREATCRDRPSIGIPAHVTILFPFAPPNRIDAQLVDEVSSLVGRFEPFAFELHELRRFPGVLYAAPAPPAPFVELIRAVIETYPRYPPYGGEIPRDTIVPHLTVAQGEDALLSKVEDEIVALLPIAARADEVLLLEEIEPDWGRWRVRSRLMLGGTSSPYSAR
jgi:2'-5' RNA ligase